MFHVWLHILMSGMMAVSLMVSSPDPSPSRISPLDNMIRHIDNPESLSSYLSENFTFEEDSDLFGTVDYWQEPLEFWNLKKGDCEDYALFTQYVLQQKGMEAYLVSFYDRKSYAHTVTVFREENAYSVFNEDRLFRTHSKSLEEALSDVHPGWVWGAIASKRGRRGWLEQRIENTYRTPSPREGLTGMSV